MIKGKESFIKHVAHCLGREETLSTPPPFTLPSDVHHQYLQDADREELSAVFQQNSETNGTAVFTCTEAELAKTLIEAVHSFENGSVIIGDHTYFREHEIGKTLCQELSDCQLWDTEKSREENMEKAESATTGICMAELGLAESGTVVLFSHKDSGRSVSLLPTYAIHVIKADTIRPRLTQGMEFLAAQQTPLPASINFISGASATADIELVHVKGVHGPLKIAYVIVE